jgi:thioredoxin reductase (NADPH)
MTYKIIIIGSGPAGLTAGVYAGRANLTPLIIEGDKPGGQLTTTSDVENWPGEVSIKGPALMQKMRDHASKYGATFLGDSVIKTDFSSKPYKVITQSGKTLEAESIIIATGASHKKLGITGEAEYWGKGITTCATCDAPFYKDLEVVIAGGGNTAVTEASFLSRFASKITIVQNLGQLSANDPIKEKVLADPKVTIIYNSIISEAKGDGTKISSVTIENLQTKEKTDIQTSGLFVAIGFKPNTEIFSGQLEMDKFGYLKLLGNTKTSKEGIFAAGDVSDYIYMQAITAAGFGCMTALDCERYLSGLNQQ